MRKITLCTFVLLLTSSALAAFWDDCPGRGLFPLWINTGDFYTLLVFINGYESTGDVIHIRFSRS